MGEGKAPRGDAAVMGCQQVTARGGCRTVTSPPPPAAVVRRRRSLRMRMECDPRCARSLPLLPPLPPSLAAREPSLASVRPPPPRPPSRKPYMYIILLHRVVAFIDEADRFELLTSLGKL